MKTVSDNGQINDFERGSLNCILLAYLEKIGTLVFSKSNHIIMSCISYHSIALSVKHYYLFVFFPSFI